MLRQCQSMIGAASLLALPLVAQAQIYHRAIGFTTLEGAYSVETCTGPGGVGAITAGRIAPSTSALRNMYIVRYAPDGSDLWSTVIAAPNGADDVATSVRQTLDGGFIVAAETGAVSAAMGIALVRLDAAGNVVWGRAYAGTAFEDFPSGTKVRELPDGTFTVVGRSRTGVIMQGRMIHVGPGGGPLWGGSYSLVGPPAELSFTDVRFVPANGAMAAGYFVSGWVREEMAAQRSALLMRTDVAGTPLATWTYSIPNQSVTADGLTIIGNNVVLSGRISPTPTAPATRTLITSVTRAAGTVNWARVQSNFRNGFAALATDFGTIVVAGTVPTNGDIGLVKLSGAGATIFANSHDALGEGHDVVNMPGFGAGYVATGMETLAPVNGLQDVALIKTTFMGDSGCLVSAMPGPVPAVISRSERTMNRVSNQENITLPMIVTMPNSGNIVKCLGASSGPGPCRADWNHDQVVNSQDFFEFVQGFFAEDADFNFDETTNSQDFFDFLRAFFEGC